MTNKKSKAQLDQFKETARKLGADESGDALDKAMRRVELRESPVTKRPSSDQTDNTSS